MSCNHTNKNCGCEDKALRTIPTYPCPPDGNCPNPQTCDEYIPVACVIFDGQGIDELGITPGMSLLEYFQRQAIYTVDPTCVDPDSTCQSSPLLYVVNKTDTTILIAWSASAGDVVSYQVEFSEQSPVSWVLFPTQLPTQPRQLMISGLTTGTTYLIRVNSICDGGNCYSATIIVTTN